MIVYLIGFMGSGKSTAGKKIASALEWNFIDLDKEIEHKTGRLINDIFAKEGEAYFRNIESSVLKEFSDCKNTVIACGGGTPCFNSNMDFMLENGLTIYLKMTVEGLKNRLVNSHTIRPLIKSIDKDDLADYIKTSLDQRENCYNRSEIIVNGLDIDIPGLKELILKNF